MKIVDVFFVEAVATKDPRIGAFYSRIVNNQPLKLINGKSVVIDQKKSAQLVNLLRTAARGGVSAIEKLITYIQPKPGSYAPVFFTTSGQQITLRDFVNSVDFGVGGGGMSGGFQQTRIQESAQCYVIALASRLRVLNKEDVTVDALRKVSGNVAVDATLQEVVQFLKSDPTWLESCVVTANEIVRRFNTTGKTFQRQSAWIKNLDQEFRRLNQSAQRRFFPGKDRWNPADVWMLSANSDVPAFNNLYELNRWLEKKYNSQDVVGFSLKKVFKNVRLSIRNAKGSTRDMLRHTVTDLLVTKSNNLFSSKGSYIRFQTLMESTMTEARETELEFRASKAGRSIQGYVKGKIALQGSVGTKAINEILSELTLQQLTTRKVLLAAVRADKGAVLKQIYEKGKEVRGSIDKITKRAFAGLIKQLSDFDIVEKYQAVELIYILYKAPRKTQDAFIGNIMNYATGQSALSSVYVLIS